MLIEFDAVSVAFDGKTALDNVSIKLDQQHIGVIGLNGSGKSTFARLASTPPPMPRPPVAKPASSSATRMFRSSCRPSSKTLRSRFAVPA
jgi:ABC-type molybdenum transport system ATPase subunit/photorepair protein PhrA